MVKNTIDGCLWAINASATLQTFILRVNWPLRIKDPMEEPRPGEEPKEYLMW